jgi:hypothetical protein
MKRPVLISAIIFIFLVGTRTEVLCQTPVSGFYFVVKTKKNCLNTLPSFDKSKKYCLTKEPIIASSEFEDIGDMQFDSMIMSKYFILRLSENAFKTFKMLVNKLPSTGMALVTDGVVAGVFQDPHKILNRSIPVRGGVDEGEVDWIHEKLIMEKKTAGKK